LILNDTGAIYSTGKSSYEDTTAGFFLGGSGTAVSIGNILSGTSYSVSVIPTGDSEDVGAIYVSDKTSTTFVINCTGTGVPTFDWILVDGDSITAATLGVYSGADTFAGSAGATVAIGDTLSGTAYNVLITPTGDSEDVGDIYVDTKTTSTFKVKCTGAGTPTFDWVLVDQANIVSATLGIWSGEDTFSGSAGATVSIGGTLSGTDYGVSIIPTGDSEDVGAIYVDTKTTSTFKVKCTGTGTPTFDWVLVDKDVVASATLGIYSGSGTFEGIPGGDAKFNIGDATNYLKWDGSSLDIAGAITATSGTIGGFTSDPTEGFYAGTGATRVQMKPGAGFWAGATAVGDAPFRVSAAGALVATSANITGEITATSGAIGGFTVDATDGIYAGTGATRVQMKPGAGFWAGATAVGDAPFRVSAAGALVATSANITGTINASAGNITGNFNVTSGGNFIVNDGGDINVASGGSLTIDGGGDLILAQTVSTSSKILFQNQAGYKAKLEQIENDVLFSISPDYKFGAAGILSIGYDDPVRPTMDNGMWQRIYMDSSEHFLMTHSSLRTTYSDIHSLPTYINLNVETASASSDIDIRSNIVTIDSPTVKITGDFQFDTSASWIGLSSTTGRITFTDATPDLLTFNSCNVAINDNAFIGLGSSAGRITFNSHDPAEDQIEFIDCEVTAEYEIISTDSAIGKEALTLDQNDEDQPFIKFDGAIPVPDDASKNVTTWKTGAVLGGYIRVNVNGTDLWMPVYSAPTSA